MTSPRRIMVLVPLALLIVAVVGVLVFVVPAMREDEAAPSPDSGTSSTTVNTDPPPANSGAQGFGTPTSDLSGRLVMVPNNPAGQPLPQRGVTGARTECTPDGQPVTSPEKVMIQNNFGADTLYSETDGPARLDGLVLSGYAHTPQGAALAAANFTPRLYTGGPVSVETIEKLTDVDYAAKITPESLDSTRSSPIDTSRKYVRAPYGFRILSCAEDFAVVELAMIRDVDDTGKQIAPVYSGWRLNMVWKDGVWKVRANDKAIFGPYTSLDGFTRWTA